MTDEEINAEVATKIMGWELLEVGYVGTESETKRQKELENWIDRVEIDRVGEYWIDVENDEWLRTYRWNPAQNIDQAWQILEKFTWPEYGIIVRGWSETEWKCTIDSTDGPDLSAIAETAPKAICLAVLKTLESD